MAAAWVQSIFSGNSKTSGVSLTISGAVTVTTGNDIFVSFGSDDGTSNESLTHQGGALIIWNMEGSALTAAHCKSILFRGHIIRGGPLRSITCTWTGAVTAKAMISEEWSGIGSAAAIAGASSTVGALVFGTIGPPLPLRLPGDVHIGACCGEHDTTKGTWTGSVAPASFVPGGQSGTTGGADASNITVAIGNQPATSYTTYKPAPTSSFNTESGVQLMGVAGAYRASMTDPRLSSPWYQMASRRVDGLNGSGPTFPFDFLIGFQVG